MTRPTTTVNVVSTGAKHALLIGGSVLMCAPFVWMFLSSLKDFAQVFVIPPSWIPDPVRFENYTTAWNALPFARAFFNSVYIALVVVVVQLLTSSMAAYAFARIKFRFRGPLFVVFLAMMMVPNQVTIIPVYLIMKNLGWLDTHLSLIVPASLHSVFAIFLLRQFIRGIPKELDEAATIDGANRWTIYWRIILPLLKAPLAALAIFGFMVQWNSFFLPLIFLSSPEKYTVPLLVSQLKGSFTTDYPLLMAAASLAVVPVLIVFVFAQRHIIQGVALTGVKA